MKTKLIIEIESPDTYEIFPEDGQTNEDWEGKEKELAEERKEYSKDLHNRLVSYIKDYFNESIDEQFIDDLDENYIEGWDELKDYGIKIDIKEEK